jgi:anthranilate phosphoribosyltransferase
VSLARAIACAVQGDEVAPDVLESAFGEIMDGKATPVGIAALLVALRTKGETVGEIVAAARALRARATCVRARDPRTVDTCGTGGDGAGTFNVSTAAALVAAGAGVPVAKHGNRAASSRTGSADVLEALGVRVDLPIEASARILDELGIGFFFARRAHPALRHAAEVRRELGIRTILNCVGPLLSPVEVRRQLVGVSEPSLVEALAHALAALGAERALVVHGEDGLDEITTTARTQAALLEGSHVRRFAIDPQALGIARARGADLAGGDPAHNAAIVREVLAGGRGPRRDVVLLNAAAALWVAGAAEDLAAGLALAADSVDSGRAREKLEALARATAAAETPA